jgi:hypothetical protein
MPHAAEPPAQQPEADLGIIGLADEQEPPLTATERSAMILGLLAHDTAMKIDDDVLKQTLDDFALLKQLSSKASEEEKAENFLRQLAIVLYQNSKRVAVAKAEAQYNAKSPWTLLVQEEER